MKKVFSNHSEVCHVFASQTQSEGRANNISFRNNRLLSYHYWTMAKIVTPETQPEQIVLFRNWAYSVSTAKHMNHARYALNHFTFVYVYDPDNLTLSINEAFNNLKHSYNNCSFKLSLSEYNTNKSAHNTLKSIFKYFPSLYVEFEHYVIDNEPALMAEIEIKQEKNRIANEKREEARRIANETYYKRLEIVEKMKVEFFESKEHANILDSYRRGEHIQKTVKKYYEFEGRQYNFIIDLFSWSSPVILSLQGDEIVTNKGARVPVREAKILLHRIRTKKDVKGFQIGMYTVISINGTLKIGCHEISRNEIDNFCRVNNW